MLSMFDEDELVLAAVRAGALGYLLKDADDDQIAGVVARHRARGGDLWTSDGAERDSGISQPST